MTGSLRDLAIAVWNVDEMAEALTADDLADLSFWPVVLHLQNIVQDLQVRGEQLEERRHVR